MIYILGQSTEAIVGNSCHPHLSLKAWCKIAAGLFWIKWMRFLTFHSKKSLCCVYSNLSVIMEDICKYILLFFLKKTSFLQYRRDDLSKEFYILCSMGCSCPCSGTANSPADVMVSEEVGRMETILALEQFPLQPVDGTTMEWFVLEDCSLWRITLNRGGNLRGEKW